MQTAKRFPGSVPAGRAGTEEPQMIKMYGYIPAWGVPDVSPFVTKIDCYLRMVDLPYELVKLERAT